MARDNGNEICPVTGKIHDWEMGIEPFTYFCYKCDVLLTHDEEDEPVDFSTEDSE